MNMVKQIDWSCKHDIMIRNPDGTYSHMDEPYFRSEKIAPGTWKILSSGDYSYLVEGEKEAIAIDTGYGAGNIREYLQTLTKMPLSCVINTHDHFDHTANNGYFDKAYMSTETKLLATIPFQSFQGIDFPQDYEKVVVEDGYLFDLGKRTLEVFKIPDHAAGSIALLDKRERLFFTGDEFMAMPMGKKLRVGLTTFLGYLKKMEACRKEFDYLCAGGGVLDARLLDQYYECACYILEGHEGEEACGEPVHMPPMTKHVDGKVVYDRIMPHPGDGGTKEPLSEKARIRCMKHAGVQIIYDASRLKE